MEYDNNKIDEMVLALLYLTSFDQKVVIRAWKSHDWDALDRLYEKGYISDPKSKANQLLFLMKDLNYLKNYLRTILQKPPNKRFNADGLSSSMSKSVAKSRRRLSADR
jgi:hypothetical protein